ncbi:class I SAM-dependent methyltransferase [Candidatus Bathyarchaeota archaeon]|nr:class I SAM-dependent methyltransferase [Candidatus Bathyarchaeota archaeon]
MSNAFDDAAEAYDAVRPGYPDELFDDIASLTGLKTGARVLEVGCGTGQATVGFAERGYTVLCVDPGGSLVDVARRRLSGYPVGFTVSRFEDWVSTEGFDLVASGTAWHWVDPLAGYAKAAAALREGGFIALFWNLHPTPYTGFFEAVQRVYRRVVPEWGDPRDRPSTDQRIQEIRAQIGSSRLFEKPVVKRYSWTRSYSKTDYLRLLETYSDHHALPREVKSLLYEGIGKGIDEDYGGVVERPYLTVLFVARKI